MDNTIRPASYTAAAPVTLQSAPPAPAPAQADTPATPAVEDSVSLGTAQPPVEAPPAPEAAAPPAAPAAPTGFVNVPVTLAVPMELVTPDADGNIPLQQYTPDLRPPNAIYTTQDEITELVDQVKKQTLPPGTHAELDMSKGGHKIDVAQKTFGKVLNNIGGLATYSIAREGAALTLPGAVASPIALIAGGVNVYTGLEQAKESLNLKGYYEGLQKQGVEALPVQIPVRSKEGTQVQQVEVPIGTMIKSARDTAVVGGAQALSGVFMMGAGIAMLAALPVAPALALGSIVLNIAAPLYAARGQLATVAKAAWEKLKDKFHKGGKDEAPQPAQTAPTASAGQPQQVAAVPPEQAVQPGQAVQTAPSQAPTQAEQPAS